MTNAIRNYFETAAPAWDARMPPDLGEALRALLAPFADTLRGARMILEIGTGTGALIPPLRAVAPGARLLSVDLAHAMLCGARARAAGACVAQADVHRLPLAAGGWDVALCHNSFPHFADRPRALTELRRALRPGGTLLLLHNNPRARINAIHAQAGGAIADDLLPPGEVVRDLLVAAGYVGVCVEDTDAHYIASARAGA